MGLVNKFDCVCVDLDDVLCDFVDAAYKVIGKQNKKKRRNYNIAREEGKHQEKFIEIIQSRGSQFWSTLAPKPYYKEILLLAELFSKEEVHIVTRPMRFMECYIGKAHWVAAHIGSEQKIEFLTDKTWMLQKYKNCLLIDDCVDNCEKFISAGGKAIVFPEAANEHYAIADTSAVVDYVHEQLIKQPKEK